MPSLCILFTLDSLLPLSLPLSLTLLAMLAIFDCPYTHLTYYKPLIDVAPGCPPPHPRFVLCACLCCLLLIYVFVCSLIFRTTFAMRLTKVDAHSSALLLSLSLPLPLALSVLLILWLQM